jgi:hypothetical protein
MLIHVLKSKVHRARVTAGNVDCEGRLRTPEPLAWMEAAPGIDVSLLTPSLSPSEGERVPFRAGEGSSAASPRFHGSGYVSLGIARAILDNAGRLPYE